MADQQNNQSSTRQEYQAVRLNFLDPPEFRNTSTSKDQIYINGYFDPVYNQIKKGIDYFFTKRPGTNQFSAVSAATARGIYYWNNQLYAVFGNKIYGAAADLGVTLAGSTGQVGFAETRPGAATQYLGVNDGTALYLIKTDNSVTVLNNKAISTSSIANPTVITTATAHGLNTGNKVYIVGHTGSTPDINGTVYTITKTSATTFTIPVNVTVDGTGGTLGVFPATNTGDLEYMDGYWVTAKSDGTIWNCDLDNPLVWDPTKFITAQMYPGNLIGLAHTNNYLFAFGDGWMQAFYDGANASGSFLTNLESAVQQIGSASNAAISHEENSVFWVSMSRTGGFSVWQLDGTSNIKEVGIPSINRIMAQEADIATCYANVFRIAGKFLYVLTLVTANRTFVYDKDLEIWMEWTSASGTAFPVFDVTQAIPVGTNTLYVQHPTNGRVNILTTEATQDANDGSFPVTVRTKRFDGDIMKRKFCSSLDLIGDKQSSTTNVTVQYSDDDYNTLSTARTMDMSQTRCFGKGWGSFRRRSWQVSYTGANPLRMVGIEIDYSIGDR